MMRLSLSFLYRLDNLLEPVRPEEARSLRRLEGLLFI